MEAIKAEIERKRKQLEDSKVVSGGQKYFKRSELMARNEEAYLVRHGLQKAATNEANAKFAKANASVKVEVPKAGSGNMEDLPKLSRREVIRRLRERGEPILLFGETEEESSRRLRKMEILEPEVNRGFRNDFQAALEQVDQAYLEEIIRTSKSGPGQAADKKKKLGDVHVMEDSYTYDVIVPKAQEVFSKSKNMEERAKTILEWVKFLLKCWGKYLNSRSEEEKLAMRGKLSSATYTQTVEYMKPLLRKLKSCTLQDDILECLVDIVKFMLDKEYIKANDAYLEMAIGNAPWPIGVTMVGIHARTGREKIFSRNVAHVMNDETQRKYIQGLKRLMTKCQQMFPTDPSKCVEYQPEACLDIEDKASSSATCKNAAQSE
ncbi:pre-mRNA-splicing factor 18 [Folsomia candida]|uniref:Pre-mRNA-splicing factor 18 n=1 Tax=Folsomia candida TaxID=158441 RepID=A0A226DY79_FOLCA|nr:pre-mRNA-splicing factor 18 [Folsomia candida]OXA49988.1 Pre-mRNA-splicing factor 18 [Folsomia candida]